MQAGEEELFKERGGSGHLGTLQSSSRPKRFLLVEDSASLEEVDSIVTEKSVVVGIDAEWPPDMNTCGKPCATVLQLACLCNTDEDDNEDEYTIKDDGAPRKSMENTSKSQSDDSERILWDWYKGSCRGHYFVTVHKELDKQMGKFERLVILFDLQKMLHDHNENGIKLKRMFKTLLKRKRCLKIGHSLDMDVRAVSMALDCETVAVNGAVNVTSLFSRLWHVGLWKKSMQPSACKSLNNVMSTVLDVSLEKSYQCSAWGDRPLSQGQLVYAANDAACLLDLFLMAHCVLYGVEVDQTCVKRRCIDGVYSIDSLPDGGIYVPVTKGNLFHSIEQFGQHWSWKYGRLHIEKTSDFWTRKPSVGNVDAYPVEISKHGTKQSRKKNNRGKESIVDPSRYHVPMYIPWMHSVDQEVRSQGPRFICDVMLYGLSRQLRLWGIDCESLPTLPKSQRHLSHRRLVEQAEDENRVILTKDTIFYDRRLSDQVYFVHSDTKQNQLHEVVLAFNISVERDALLSRCPYCNSDFDPVPVAPEKLPKDHEVPDGVLEKVKEFWVCSGCRKAYWRGSQYNRAMEHLNAAFTGLQVDNYPSPNTLFSSLT